VRGEFAKPHSIILTSGTLSPMKSFESELMLDFPVKLDNGHVINTKTQVRKRKEFGIIKKCQTFIVQNGMYNYPISFTYEDQKSDDIVIDAGFSLSNTL